MGVVSCVTVCVPMAVEGSRGDRSDISASKTDHTPSFQDLRKQNLPPSFQSLRKIKSKFEEKNQKFKKKAHQESGWNPPSWTFMLLDLFECQPKFLRLQLYKYEIHLMLRSWTKEEKCVEDDGVWMVGDKTDGGEVGSGVPATWPNVLAPAATTDPITPSNPPTPHFCLWPHAPPQIVYPATWPIWPSLEPSNISSSRTVDPSTSLVFGLYQITLKHLTLLAIMCLCHTPKQLGSQAPYTLFSGKYCSC